MEDSNLHPQAVLPHGVVELMDYVTGAECRGVLSSVWANLSVSTEEQSRLFSTFLSDRVTEAIKSFVLEERAKEAKQARIVELLFRNSVALSKRLSEPFGADSLISAVVATVENAAREAILKKKNGVFSLGERKCSCESSLDLLWIREPAEETTVTTTCVCRAIGKDIVDATLVFSTTPETAAAANVTSDRHSSRASKPNGSGRVVRRSNEEHRAACADGKASGGEETVTNRHHTLSTTISLFESQPPFLLLPLSEKFELLRVESQRLQHIAKERLRLIAMVQDQHRIANLPIREQSKARSEAASAMFATHVGGSTPSSKKNSSAGLMSAASASDSFCSAQSRIASLSTNRSQTLVGALAGHKRPRDSDTAVGAGAATSRECSSALQPFFTGSARPSLCDEDFPDEYQQDLSLRRIVGDAELLYSNLALIREEMYATIDDEMEEISFLIATRGRIAEVARASQQAYAATQTHAVGGGTTTAATASDSVISQQLANAANDELEFKAFAARVEADVAFCRENDGIDSTFEQSSVLFHELPMSLTRLFVMKMPTATLSAVSDKLKQLQSLLYDEQLLLFAEKEEQVAAAYQKYFSITGDVRYSKAPHYGDLLKERGVGGEQEEKEEGAAALSSATPINKQLGEDNASAPIIVTNAADGSVGGSACPLTQHSNSFNLLSSFNEEELNKYLDRNNGGNGKSMWLGAAAAFGPSSAMNAGGGGGGSNKPLFESCLSTASNTMVLPASPAANVTTAAEPAAGAAADEDEEDNARSEKASGEAKYMLPPHSFSTPATAPAPCVRATCGTPFAERQAALKATFRQKMRNVLSAVAYYDRDLAEISEQLHIMSTLFKLVVERDEILVAKQQLAARSKEMLLSRSAHMAQALKLDNEVRKKVSVRIPQVVAEIVALCEAWERLCGKRAFLNGKDVLYLVTSGGEELVLGSGGNASSSTLPPSSMKAVPSIKKGACGGGVGFSSVAKKAQGGASSTTQQQQQQRSGATAASRSVTPRVRTPLISPRKDSAAAPHKEGGLSPVPRLDLHGGKSIVGMKRATPALSTSAATSARAAAQSRSTTPRPLIARGGTLSSRATTPTLTPRPARRPPMSEVERNNINNKSARAAASTTSLDFSQNPTLSHASEKNKKTPIRSEESRGATEKKSRVAVAAGENNPLLKSPPSLTTVTPSSAAHRRHSPPASSFSSQALAQKGRGGMVDMSPCAQRPPARLRTLNDVTNGKKK